ncbi:MAG: TrmH family RNA methyltransferase [Candidatus Pacebacteria bacterium]|nr:TrmH family RNA methyltransferase [Candidatus Paceibacterota bacterium]
MKKSVWLHNIRSVYNVGSIFRTADAVGVDHIYLSGYTPLPIDRFGRNRADMHKIALGAEQSVSWSQLKNIPDDITQLKESGARLICVEQDNNSIQYNEYIPKDDVQELILAMGEETTGFDAEILSLADTIIEIPMRGKKESLNVSVAFGIAAYSIFK